MYVSTAVKIGKSSYRRGKGISVTYIMKHYYRTAAFQGVSMGGGGGGGGASYGGRFVWWFNDE